MTTLRGTLLTPGVSKNKRSYTPELIHKAFDRLAERVADGSAPVTMLTHHDAGDDSTKIVGRVTSVKLVGDKINYTAELAPTPDGQTIEALVSAKQPYLRNVSIRGAWIGPVRKEMVDGEAVETADDLEITGLDFTKSPGVAGATVELANEAATESDGRTLITESVDALAEFTETVPRNNWVPLMEAWSGVNEDGLPPEVDEADKAPYGAVQYADPGYQADKKKRYPIDTAAHAKAAWAYINKSSNADAYSDAQLKRVKARIKSALTKFGVDTSETDGELVIMTEQAQTETTLSECMACDNGTGTAGFSISAYNGPLTVTVSAYNGIEPADLADVAMAAMAAAVDAIKSMDPDVDGDIDTGTTGEGTVPDDNQMEAAPDTKEAPVAENTAETATEVETEIDQDAPVTRAELAAALAKLAPAVVEPAAETAPAEVVAETAPVTAGITEAAVAEAIQKALEAEGPKMRAEIVKEMARTGVLGRKGLVEGLEAPDKPLHEMSDEEFRAVQAERMVPLVFPGR